MNSPSDLDYYPEVDNGTPFFSAVKHLLEKCPEVIENVHALNPPQERISKLYAVCSPCELPLHEYVSDAAQDAMPECTYEEFVVLLDKIVKRNDYVNDHFIEQFFTILKQENIMSTKRSFFSALNQMLCKSPLTLREIHATSHLDEIFKDLYDCCPLCEKPLSYYITSDAQDAMQECTYEEFTYLLKRIIDLNRIVNENFINDFFKNLRTINESKEFDGLKYDADKPYSGLLIGFAPALKEVVKVATFGAKKYGRDNWKNLENGKMRYFDAAWRHKLAAEGDFDAKDEESNFDHIAHEIWNLLALYTIHINERRN
jgi:hypothetical protein